MSAHARDVVHDRREPAARRIAHEAQTVELAQRQRQGQHARGVRLQVAAQSELLAGEKHRDTMRADRTAHQHRVRRLDSRNAERQRSRPRADAGRRQIQATALAASHDLGVTRNDGHAHLAGSGGEAHHDALELRDLETFFREHIQSSDNAAPRR